MINDKFYVYIHSKIDSGDVFYVGKGHGNRHLSLSGRNSHWKNTTQKHVWKSEVVTPLLSELDAFYIERMLIDIYRNSGVKLCNISDGGEGAAGVKHTDETKEKFRLAKLGVKQSPEHAAKSASAKKGKKQTPNAILSTMIVKSKKVINSDGEIFFSVSDAVRFLSKKYNKKISQGNISLCAMGDRPLAYGLTWSYDISKIPALKRRQNGTRKKIINKTKNEIFDSVTEAVESVKLIIPTATHQTISSCARGEISKAYGFEWYYL